MIEVNKFYTYSANPLEMQCLARYAAGGVAVHHTTRYDKTPAFGAVYLSDEDFEKGLIKEITPPVRGFVNLVYDGNIDQQYFVSQVYATMALAAEGFNLLKTENPYARLMRTLELKP
jgi:hypothetical protein